MSFRDNEATDPDGQTSMRVAICDPDECAVTRELYIVQCWQQFQLRYAVPYFGGCDGLTTHDLLLLYPLAN